MTYSVNFNNDSSDELNFSISGDRASYKIDFGDGSRQAVDGGSGTGPIFHDYSGDGTYELTIRESGSGTPPSHFNAYLYWYTSTDLHLNCSSRVDFVESGQANDVIGLGAGDDIASGDNGDDRIFGGAGNDYMAGGQGNDILYGGAGADILDGGTDDDVLHGGTGNDLLFDTAGQDLLQGGSGADMFRFAYAYNIAASGRDEVTDFSGINGQGDKISVGANGSYDFIGSKSFDGTAPELREVQGSSASEHVIQGDSNGDGTADFSFIVRGDLVTASDFVGLANEALITPNDSHPTFAMSLHPVDYLMVA